MTAPHSISGEVEVEHLREWKSAILEKCKASDGFNALEWGGDKEGWGFVHYFIGHLETRALHAETVLAEQSSSPSPQIAGDVRPYCDPLDQGKAFYLAMYEHEGANWDANENQEVWVKLARDYERRRRATVSAQPQPPFSRWADIIESASLTISPKGSKELDALAAEVRAYCEKK